ncbi:hypothetical protein V6O07_10715, partial [Arthrospira platensis SPKY2]
NLLINYKEWQHINHLKFFIKDLIFSLHNIENQYESIITYYNENYKIIIDLLQEVDKINNENKQEILSRSELLIKELCKDISIEHSLKELKIQCNEIGNIYYNLSESDRKDIDMIASRYKSSFYERNFSLEQLIFMSSGYFLCIMNMDVKYLTPNQIGACKGIIQEVIRKQKERDKIVHYYISLYNPSFKIESITHKDSNFQDQIWLKY